MTNSSSLLIVIVLAVVAGIVFLFQKPKSNDGTALADLQRSFQDFFKNLGKSEPEPRPDTTPEKPEFPQVPVPEPDTTPENIKAPKQFANEAQKQISEQKQIIEQAKEKGIVFNETEKADIVKLDSRREKSKGTAKFFTKLSGEDTVILKKLEAEKAKVIFDSSKIQKTSFVTKDQQKAIDLQKQQVKQATEEQNKQTVKQIKTQIGTTTTAQKRNLQKMGINLQGDALSDAALLQLRARGLI